MKWIFTMVMWFMVACEVPMNEEVAESVFTVPLARGEHAAVSEVLPQWVELSANRPVNILAPAHTTVVRKRPGSVELRDGSGNLLVVDGLLSVEPALVVGSHVCAGTPMGMARDRWRLGAFRAVTDGADPYANPSPALVRVVLRATVRTLAEAEVYEEVKSLLAREGEEGEVNLVPGEPCPFTDGVQTGTEQDESEVDDDSAQ